MGLNANHRLSDCIKDWGQLRRVNVRFSESVPNDDSSLVQMTSPGSECVENVDKSGPDK